MSVDLGLDNDCGKCGRNSIAGQVVYSPVAKGYLCADCRMGASIKVSSDIGDFEGLPCEKCESTEDVLWTGSFDWGKFLCLKCRNPTWYEMTKQRQSCDEIVAQ